MPTPFESPKDVWEQGDDRRFCTTPVPSKAEGQFYVGSVGGAAILPHPLAGKEVSVGTVLPPKSQQLAVSNRSAVSHLDETRKIITPLSLGQRGFGDKGE